MPPTSKVGVVSLEQNVDFSVTSPDATAGTGIPGVNTGMRGKDDDWPSCTDQGESMLERHLNTI